MMAMLKTVIALVAMLPSLIIGCGPPPSDVKHGIRQLPRRDREAARLQQTCPLTAEALGRDGAKPLKVEFAGDVLFVCCHGCASEVRSDLAKFVLGIESLEMISPKSTLDVGSGLTISEVIDGR